MEIQVDARIKKPRATNKQPKFRLCRREVGLTFPQCPLDKQIVQQELRTKLARYGLMYLVTCSEEHQNGDKHLHVAIKTAEKIDIRDARWFDMITGQGRVYHPNVCPTPDFVGWVDYVKKDKDFVEWGVSPQKKTKIQSRIDKYMNLELKGIRKAVLEGDLDIQQVPLIAKALEIMHKEELKEELDLQEDLPHEIVHRFQNGFQKTFSFVQPNEETRRVHYWIHSSPGTGKTYFTKQLEKRFNTLRDTGLDFFTLATDRFQLLLIDEHPNRSVNELNKMCDNTFAFNMKGVSPAMRNYTGRFYWVIVCCNVSIDQFMNRGTANMKLRDIQTTALKQRFNEVDLDALPDIE